MSIKLKRILVRDMANNELEGRFENSVKAQEEFLKRYPNTKSPILLTWYNWTDAGSRYISFSVKENKLNKK